MSLHTYDIILLLRYFVFTSKHHDGFTNWPSSYSFGWNSMDVGAHRDVVGELRQGFADHAPGVKFGLYYSLYEWFNPLCIKDTEANYTTRYST